MGAAPWFGLGYEFKCEQTLATSSNAKASKSVPFGGSFLSSTWFFSQPPFWPGLTESL